ncbi:MAG: hypothetical protein B7X07_06360 [Actinobacteria bacterium 21-64-8]|nr:MAG: hypothetical protein B7X07_06360 [Actinobacteria bacterium 21-64-8]
MSRFEDYEKVVDPLILPIRGKDYVIPEVSMPDGLKYTKYVEELTAAEESRKTDPDAPLPEPLDNDVFRHMMLGAAYDEMVADGVPAAAVSRALVTATANFQTGRASAEIMWATGGDPKAIEKYLMPNRAARRASARSTGTGSAKKTPSPASTNSTKTSPTGE